MQHTKKIQKPFINILKQISKKRRVDFSGIGLILYDAKFFSDVPAVPLRPSSQCPQNLFINKAHILDFLLASSQNSHPLHEGYHFFNEKGKLTHISQYLITPNIPETIPDELHGARYLSAKLGSYIKGIICIGIVACNGDAFYFERGQAYRLISQWDNIYKKGKDKYRYYNIIKPHKDINKVIKIFKDQGINKVLDLGCGAGRHLLYLAQGGFQTYGIDSSKQGIKISKSLLKNKVVKASLKIGSVFERLPYKNNFFDAIISIQVLQHGSMNQIEKAISEIKRILKPQGFIFITLCGRYSKGKIRYCLVKTAQKVGPNAYVPTIGDEKGLIHYIYNKQILINHYKDFKIIKIWKDEKDYYCFLGKNKK